MKSTIGYLILFLSFTSPVFAVAVPNTNRVASRDLPVHDTSSTDELIAHFISVVSTPSSSYFAARDAEPKSEHLPSSTHLNSSLFEERDDHIQCFDYWYRTCHIVGSSSGSHLSIARLFNLPCLFFTILAKITVTVAATIPIPDRPLLMTIKEALAGSGGIKFENHEDEWRKRGEPSYEFAGKVIEILQGDANLLHWSPGSSDWHHNVGEWLVSKLVEALVGWPG